MPRNWKDDISIIHPYSTRHLLTINDNRWFATFLISLLVTWTAGKTNDRSIHIICLMCVSCIGNIIVITSTNNAVRFFAMFLMPMGAVSAYQILVAWVAVCPLSLNLQTQHASQCLILNHVELVHPTDAKTHRIHRHLQHDR